MQEGVEIPTKADFLNVLKGFMEATEDGENTAYSVNAEPLVSALTTLLDWVNERSEKTVAEVLFELIGDELKEFDETLVDVDALCNYLKTNLPGTLKVEDVLDKLITLLEETEVATLADLYDIIDTIMSDLSGQEFDTEAMVSQYYGLTLNNFLAAYIPAEEPVTAEQLYDQLAAMAKDMLVGDIYAYQGTVSDWVTMLKAQLAAYEVTAEFSFTVDKDGKLIALNVNDSFGALVPKEDEEGFDVMYIQGLTVSIDRDATIKAEVPEEFLPVLGGVTVEPDADGNYVVSGMPAGSETEIYVEGGTYVNLGDVLQLDTDMSANYGYNVYTTHKDLWTDSIPVTTLVLINGKYYRYEGGGFGYNDSVSSFLSKSFKTDLFEFVNDPYSILPTDLDTPDFYCDDEAVYGTGIGLLVQRNGQWYVCGGKCNIDKEGNFVLTDLDTMYRFDERFGGKNVEISSINNKSYSMWGVNADASINIYIGKETYNFNGVRNGGSISLAYFLTVNSSAYVSTSLVLTEEVDISTIEYDRISKYQRTCDITLNGETYKTNVWMCELHRAIPTYYVKVAEGMYARLGYVKEGNFANNETKQLPDGNVMYVVGTTYAEKYGFEWGNLYYGYVSIAKNRYMRRAEWRNS